MCGCMPRALFRSGCQPASCHSGLEEAIAWILFTVAIYRDLKPGNILVMPGGVAKLLDFELAKRISFNGLTRRGEHTLSATQAGTILGTPAYISLRWNRNAEAIEQAQRALRATETFGAASVCRPFDPPAVVSPGNALSSINSRSWVRA